jgi:hypothetical protein
VPQNINQIKADHCTLMKAYNINNVLHAAIDSHSVVTMMPGAMLRADVNICAPSMVAW